MTDDLIPALPDTDLDHLFSLAAASPRRRHAHILHAPGDELNRVFNAMMHDSYMQPHHHPGPEKIEHIHLVRGEVMVFFFTPDGRIETTTLLSEQGTRHIAVPAYQWHTYAILSESALTYETMMGVYDPQTWKAMGGWAPAEQTPEHPAFLSGLKREAAQRLGRPVA